MSIETAAPLAVTSLVPLSFTVPDNDRGAELLGDPPGEPLPGVTDAFFAAHPAASRARSANATIALRISTSIISYDPPLCQDCGRYDEPGQSDRGSKEYHRMWSL